MTLSLLKKSDTPPEDGQAARPSLRWRLVGHMPVKRSINFVTVGEKPIDWRIAIPAIVLICVLAGVVSKVTVIDRFAALDAARSEVYQLQAQIAQKREEINNFKDISVDYAHYTTHDLTAEEYDRISRVTVMDVVQEIILPVAPLDAWTLHENTLSIHVSSNTLTEITAMVQQLQESPVVSSCAIVTASTTVSTNENISNEETITAEVDITFKTASVLIDEAKAAEEAARQAVEAAQQTGQDAAQQEGVETP
ncbi:MAG: hypothetical protein IJR48_09165 [Oscillibacter sp.]|nr:hypothetical protein [Oscillibacter sp.]